MRLINDNLLTLLSLEVRRRSISAVDEAAQSLPQGLAFFGPAWVRIIQVEQFWVAARLAAAQQDFLRAATLFGLAERLSSDLDYVATGPWRLTVDGALVAVRAALALLFAQAFAVGQQMSLAEVFATILRPP